MDDRFWEARAADPDKNYNEEFAKFIRDLALSLRCASVLEVGCNAGNDLRLFPGSVATHGIDSNPGITAIAKARLPSFEFKTGSVADLPYEDSSIDMIFTHGFFNYLGDDMVDAGLAEIFRVAGRYVANCEIRGDNDPIGGDENRRGRDMYEKWLNYKVKIVSNVEMHEEIDPEKPRFVLVKKL